jgi:hypothetical protein
MCIFVPPCCLRTQYHVRFTYLWTCCVLDTASLRLSSYTYKLIRFAACAPSLHGHIRIDAYLQLCLSHPFILSLCLPGWLSLRLSVHPSVALFVSSIYLYIYPSSLSLASYFLDCFCVCVCVCMCILAVTTKLTQLNMRPKRSLI